MNTYTLTDLSQIIPSGLFWPGKELTIADRTEEDAAARKVLKEYFSNAFLDLENRLHWFRDLKRPLTYQEQHELDFLLHALINAKESLYSEK